MDRSKNFKHYFPWNNIEEICKNKDTRKFYLEEHFKL